ncbi:MAG: sensor histidine kinase [Myxococcota bacterium]
MPSDSDPNKLPKERRETDRVLHHERRKSDEHIGQASADETSAVVLRARGRADEVLGQARDRADQILEREGSTSGQRRALREERAAADLTLQKEHVTADARVTDESDDRVRALTGLLRHERERTDEALLVERLRGDATTVATSDFMGMVTHDLRNLLGAIALVAEVQLQTAADDEPGRRARDAARKIQRLTARTSRLVGDLVDVASIEAGQFATVPTTSEVRVLVQDSIDAFEPLAASKDISLEASIAASSLVASFDYGRILQVLANLLANAIKFTDKGGRVTLRVEATDTDVCFSVTDTGAGIAPDQLEPIFERFWQVTKNDRRGLGLGLFISKCIVESHAGRIWAESTVGKGSTFCFTLPRVAAALAPR